MSFPFKIRSHQPLSEYKMNQFTDELGLNEEVNENSSTNHDAVLCKM